MEDMNTPREGGTAVSVQLAEEVIARFGGGSVENIEKLSGGASYETWSFDWTDASGRVTGLILRCDLDNACSTRKDGPDCQFVKYPNTANLLFLMIITHEPYFAPWNRVSK
jgi:hypothetical protein